ncbi:MAG: GGDEF domain-containing protein [Candidatus Accumulibacter sp.]|jgi:diguanylate cyclase (GGDEF)-like protein|nr:GGDEF domain-containing protein [Accumulibacter sp.]
MTISDSQLAMAILWQMDLTIFRRVGVWQYKLFGTPSRTFTDYFKQDAASGDFWTQSDMLDFFLHDVEEYFEQGRSGGISSGVWQEAGEGQEEASFVAYALNLSGEQLVVVRALGDEYADKARILRQARVNLLERRRLNVDLNEYREKSRHDGLTGLFNRATFDELLRENMALSRKTGASLSLIIIDIDNFKNVNDTFGHVAGDRVLVDLAQIMLAILRREDAVCRYGGEEFAILVQYTTRNQVSYAAEKIRGNVENHAFEALPRITVSVGCSTYQPGETPEDFINRADAALYEAKRGGKNRVVVN